MRLFVVVTEKVTLAIETSIKDYFGENNFGFWHRLPNTWFLIVHDESTAHEVRAGLRQNIPQWVDVIVVEADPKTIAYALSPTSSEWFHRHWGLAPVTEDTDAA